MIQLLFEKELLYCKLTVASTIQKGQPLVSFGAVGRWSFAVLKQGLINLGKFQKDLSWFVRSCCLCELFRGLQNLEAPLKGFNCYGAKLPLQCAVSRFAKPRCSLQRGRFSCFSLVRKEPKVHQRFANLWTPGTIQIAGRYGVFAKMTGFHQVTGFVQSRNFAGYRRQ